MPEVCRGDDVNGWVAGCLTGIRGDANRRLLMALRSDRAGARPVIIADHHLAAAPLLRRVHSVCCVGLQTFEGALVSNLVAIHEVGMGSEG